VAKLDSRVRLVTYGPGLEVELLAFRGYRNKRMSGSVLHLAPGATHNGYIYDHEREDFLFVLSGCLEVEADGRLYRLGPGDAASFSLSNPDRLINPGDSPAEVLWIVSPPGI